MYGEVRPCKAQRRRQDTTLGPLRCAYSLVRGLAEYPVSTAERRTSHPHVQKPQSEHTEPLHIARLKQP